LKRAGPTEKRSDVEDFARLLRLSAGYGFESGYALSIGPAFDHIDGSDDQYRPAPEQAPQLRDGRSETGMLTKPKC
jgi:hypothetical protein